MRVAADASLCMGSGNCVGAAPDYFEQDDSTGLVVVRLWEVGLTDAEAVARAVSLCPVAALWTDDVGPGHHET